MITNFKIFENLNGSKEKPNWFEGETFYSIRFITEIEYMENKYIL